MSRFDDLWDAVAAPLLSEQFADLVVCTRAGSSPVNVTAAIGDMQVTEETTDRGVVWRKRCLISVARTASAANGGPYLADPSCDDIWTIKGEDFSVEGIESQTESEAVLKVSRVETHEATRQSLRRRN